MAPVISVVTVTYNCAGSLADCCDSLLSQSGASAEHILIDGGSTDGTQELIDSRSDQFALCISEPDEGIYHALNKGIALATGQVVGLLHGDDAMARADVLSTVAKAFSNPAVEAVYGDLKYVAQDDPGRVIRYWRSGPFAPQRLCRGWMPPHPALFLRRSLYQRFGNFDTSYQIAADYDFMLRVLQHLVPAQVVYIPQVLTRMRVGGTSNRSLGNIARKSREDYRALRANGIGGLGTLLLKNIRKLPQFWRRSSC